MHAPYRIAARPEPEPPAEVDAYEALLRARAARGRRLVTAICGALAVLSIMALAEKPPPKRPAPDELADVRLRARLAGARDTIAAARALAAREQVRFAAAMGAVLDAGLAPERDHPPCRIALPETSGLLGGKRAFSLLVVPRGERDLPSPSVGALLEDIHRADDHLAAGRTMEAILQADALSARLEGASAWLRYDVVVVTTTMRHPVRTTPTSFEPGEVTGRAYVYDFAERRVTCVGDIHAASSPTVAYSYVPAPTAPAALDEGPQLAASLDADLERQIQQALARGALVQVDAAR